MHSKCTLVFSSCRAIGRERRRRACGRGVRAEPARGGQAGGRAAGGGGGRVPGRLVRDTRARVPHRSGHKRRRPRLAAGAHRALRLSYALRPSPLTSHHISLSHYALGTRHSALGTRHSALCSRFGFWFSSRVECSALFGVTLPFQF